MKRVKHWQDPVNALLGAWLVVSPWVLGFQDIKAAMTATVAAGVLLLAYSVGAMIVAQAWEEGVDALIGLGLLLAPGLLGFSEVTPALQNAVGCGLLVVVLSLWVLATDKEYDGWWHQLVG